MASIRERIRSDGETTYAVLYNLNGRQTSVPWQTRVEAEEFRDLINRHGPARAMEMFDIPAPPSAQPVGQRITVGQWLTRHVDQMTGVEDYTTQKYREYITNIKPVLGDIPLAKLTSEDIGRWVQSLQEGVTRRKRPRSAKTIANMHGFLASALNAAIPDYIDRNPAIGRRLPKASHDDKTAVDRMLTPEQFDQLLKAFPVYWHDFVRFLVASGCRWGEATAIKPGDVDVEAGTVRIMRAWKRDENGYHLGLPKTRRSRRTINVPRELLADVDPSADWLWRNTRGGPIRYHTFRNTWNAAVTASKLDLKPTPHDLRHTCASWMLGAGVPVTVVSRHLGHESIQITVDTYADVDRRTAELAAGVMGEIMAKTPLAIESHIDP